MDGLYRTLILRKDSYTTYNLHKYAVIKYFNKLSIFGEINAQNAFIQIYIRSLTTRIKYNILKWTQKVHSKNMTLK